MTTKFLESMSNSLHSSIYVSLKLNSLSVYNSVYGKSTAPQPIRSSIPLTDLLVLYIQKRQNNNERVSYPRGGIMPAQVTRIYPRAPILLPSLGPLPIMPCKCCQRSVWYKLGIMGDQTPKK